MGKSMPSSRASLEAMQGKTVLCPDDASKTTIVGPFRPTAKSPAAIMSEVNNARRVPKPVKK